MDPTFIDSFEPGMHGDALGAQLAPGASHFCINMEIMPSKGLRGRKRFTAYHGFKPGDTDKITAWCHFDGAVWFIIKESADEVVDNCVCRVLNGEVLRGNEAAPTDPLIRCDASLKRDFTVRWNMVVSGDSIICTAGRPFFGNADESALAPFIIRRLVTQDGSQYAAHSCSITQGENNGDGVTADVVPYLDTPYGNGAVRDDNHAMWDAADVPFSATLPIGSFVRVVLTAVVGDSEVVLLDKTMSLGIESAPAVPIMGSGRAVKITLPSTGTYPSDCSRIRYYRAIFESGVVAPALVAEWPVPLERTEAEVGMSMLGYATKFSSSTKVTGTDGTNSDALSGGVAMFYGDDPWDVVGCPYSGGFPNPMALWPSSARDSRFSTFPDALLQRDAGFLGTTPLAGLSPVVAWAKNSLRAATEDVYAIATVGRNAGYYSDPRCRGMHKFPYNASYSWTRRVQGPGSAGYNGCLMWTGKLGFMSATSHCGNLDLGIKGLYGKGDTFPATSNLNFPIQSSSDVDIPGPLTGDEQMGTRVIGRDGVEIVDSRVCPTVQQGRLNFRHNDLFADDFTVADTGGIDVYKSGEVTPEAMPSTPTAGVPVNGFARLVKALLSVDSSSRTKPHLQPFRWGLGWVGDSVMGSGPVEKLNMAMSAVNIMDRTKKTMVFLQPRPGVGNSATITIPQDEYGVEYNGFLPKSVSQSGASAPLFPILDWLSADGTNRSGFWGNGEEQTSCKIIEGALYGDTFDVVMEMRCSRSAISAYTAPSTVVATGDMVVSLSGPWAKFATISGIVFTATASGTTPPVFTATFTVEKALSDIDMLFADNGSANANEITFSVEFHGGLATWTMKAGLNLVKSYEQDIDDYSHLWFYRNDDGTILINGNDYLSVPGRFLFCTKSFAVGDLNSNDHNAGADYGWGTPSGLNTLEVDYDLGTGSYATQDAVNTALVALAAFPGGADHGRRYKNSCIDSCRMSGSVLQYGLGFRFGAETFRGFTEALGYVNTWCRIYNSGGVEQGTGPFKIISASISPGGESVWLTVAASSALVAAVGEGTVYRLTIERPADDDIFVVDDLFDGAFGQQFNDYQVMSDASYGFFSELDGVSYFGAIRSEINKSESSTSTLRWNLNGGVRPDMGFDKVMTDSGIRAMVGGDLLWVFTDKGITGYMPAEDGIPRVVAKFSDVTVQDQHNCFMHADIVYFITPKGFYSVTRDGIEELSFSNRTLFRTWVAAMGIDNIHFGLDRDEATIYIGADLEPDGENDPLFSWRYDTRLGAMDAFSWPCSISTGDLSPETMQKPTWGGYPSDMMATSRNGQVCVRAIGTEMLCTTWIINSAVLSYSIILSDGSVAVLDGGQAYWVRKALPIADPNAMKIMRSVMIGAGEGTFGLDEKISVAVTTDANRGGLSSYIQADVSNPAIQTPQPGRLPFRQLYIAAKLPIGEATPGIDFIRLDYELYSVANDGSRNVPSGELPL